jgi:hypothetical protein
VSILYARARIQDYKSQRQTSEEGIAKSR